MAASHDDAHAHPHTLHGAHHPPPPPEPKSPMWLPAVGLVLFLLAGLWFTVGPSSTDAAGREGAGSGSGAAAGADRGHFGHDDHGDHDGHGH